jgi:hypothetical protein
MLWVTAAEPALLCLIGAVLGVAVAWAAMLEARHQLFVAGASVGFDGWTIAALALTVFAILGALSLGTLRLLRSADLGEGATRRARGGNSMLGMVTDAALVVLAVVALVALSTSGALSGHTDPLASVAPGLIALGVAVLGVQLILFACRFGIALSAGSRRVAPFLALRQIARRPGVLRQARVLIIALALACFATAAWSVARTNRETAARFQVGARTVVGVAPTSPGTLEAAVARVDPHGRFAMAVADLRTPSTTLVGVEALPAAGDRRLAARYLGPRSRDAAARNRSAASSGRRAPRSAGAGVGPRERDRPDRGPVARPRSVDVGVQPAWRLGDRRSRPAARRHVHLPRQPVRSLLERLPDERARRAARERPGRSVERSRAAGGDADRLTAERRRAARRLRAPVGSPVALRGTGGLRRLEHGRRSLAQRLRGRDGGRGGRVGIDDRADGRAGRRTCHAAGGRHQGARVRQRRQRKLVLHQRPGRQLDHRAPGRLRLRTAAARRRRRAARP